MIKAEVSVSALEHNVSVLRALLSPGTALCAVLKSNAYGHRLRLAGPVIAAAADRVAVVSLEEALTLRDLGVTQPVLALFCPHAAAAFDGGRDLLREAVARDVQLTLTGPADVILAGEAAAAAGRPAGVHMEIDTGMTRSGVAPEAFGVLLAQVRAQRALVLRGVFTHFASAAEPDASFTAVQHERFRTTLAEHGLERGIIRHCANSMVTLFHPAMHLDMVRPGLAVYGYQPSPRPPRAIALKPALRLTTRLMQVRSVRKGARVGYGGTFTFERNGRVGLAPIGYGDGYPRVLSNRGAIVRVRGAWAPVVGRISMDQISLDLTGIPEAVEGDEVELIRPEASAPNSIARLAALADTIPYPLICGLQEHRTEWGLVA